MPSPITRPMTAEKIELSQVKYPILATPKLDGIRCLKVNGEALSRKFKPIPNKHIRALLRRLLREGMDGEIISGKTFSECSSNIMSYEGTPDFVYHAFDLVTEDLQKPYQDRLKDLRKAIRIISSKHVRYVPEAVLHQESELLAYEANCLKEGYEGIMLRDPDGPYKCGRATVKQGWLLKLKRFIDAEAEIIGFEELMHNENQMEINELGLTKRSSAKAGKVKAGTLGKFLVRDLESGIEFSIGTGQGLTHELRQQIWDNQQTYLGQLVKYKSQPTGVKEKPRFPIWLGFRHPDDM